MNKKGIILIITIFSINFDTDLESDVAQVNSRAELIDTTFKIVESNIQSVIRASSKKSFENLALASYHLYNNVTHEAYDMDLECEFKNLMNGKDIKIFNDTLGNKDIVFEVQGAHEWNSCNNPTRQAFIPDVAYVQKFIPNKQLFTDRIGVGINGSEGDIIKISILDSCKNEIARYDGPIINTAENDCSVGNYSLNKQVQFLKGETYYIYITGPSSSYLKLGSVSMFDDSNFFFQDINAENMTVDNYGFDPRINKTVIGFLNDINSFLNDTYKATSNYELKELRIRQEIPWEVIVEGNIIVNVQDSFFNINKVLPFKVDVNIEGLPDPMFSKFKEERIIIKEKPVSESELNFTYLINMIENKSYIKDSLSPKFIDRFSNNLNKSKCCGIETFFDPRSLVLNEHNAPTNNTLSSWRLLNKINLCQNNESRLHSFEYGNWGVATDIFLDDFNRAKFNVTLDYSPEFNYLYNGNECNP